MNSLLILSNKHLGQIFVGRKHLWGYFSHSHGQEIINRPGATGDPVLPPPLWRSNRDAWYDRGGSAGVESRWVTAGGDGGDSRSGSGKRGGGRAVKSMTRWAMLLADMAPSGNQPACLVVHKSTFSEKRFLAGGALIKLRTFSEGMPYRRNAIICVLQQFSFHYLRIGP